MISKKQLKKIAIASTFVASASFALAEAPLLQIDNTTSLSALVNASVAFNDNLSLASSGKTSDVILTVSPGLEFIMGGQDAEQTLKITVLNDIVFYMSETDNNSDLPHAKLLYAFNGDKLRASVDAGVDYIMSVTNRDARSLSLTRYWYYYANALGTYQLTERLSVMSGFKWNGTTYERGKEIYNDRQVYAVPVNVYHSVTEKLKAGLSYEYRYSDLASNSSNVANGFSQGYQQVHFFGVTADGGLTEKIRLNGRVGYTTSDWSRRSSNEGRENTMGMGIVASYDVTAKTSTSLQLSRDFEISGNGDGITSTGVQVGANHILDERWSLNGFISYKQDDYNASARKDDVYTAQIGCGYNINSYFSVNASYRFQWDDSNVSGMEYTNNLITLGLSFRY